MELTGSTVTRGLVLLEPDDSGELEMVRLDASVAIARCVRCKTRRRVLPCDALPRKTFGLAAVGRVISEYSRGDRSLRQVAWGQLGERTPAHTTLHGWTEGLGAHVLERPAAQQDGVPFGRVLADAESREPGIRAIVSAEHWVDERRFRSEDRRERLAAVAMCLAIAVLVTGQRAPDSLIELRRLVLGSASCALDFPSRFSCTPIEQAARSAAARSRANPRRGRDRCPTRTRSPPGASSRSHRS